MIDLRVKKLADLLVQYSMSVKKGDRVAITGNVHAEPLMMEVYRAALEAGGLPSILPGLDGTDELFFRYASEEQLSAPPSPLQLSVYRDFDTLLTIMAPGNLKALADVDPACITRRQQASAELHGIFNRRMGSGELRWCGTLFPTQASAQEANMGFYEYSDFVYGAGLLNSPDPIREWQKVHERQERLSRFFDSKKEFRIVSTDTDLRFRAGGRHWVNCDGKLNFPDGEVFTGPIEDSVEGHIRFSFPGIYSGKEIEDIRLTFSGGKVVEASATKGQDLLLSLLETDPGARYVGEISVGTNDGIQRFTKNMLFDEKIGGTVHLAIGRSIPQSLGSNQSSIHWDMLCDMREGGEIYADGELVYKSGRFLFE